MYIHYLTISYHNTFQILLSNQLGQSKLKRQPQGAFNKRCSMVVFQTLVIIDGSEHISIRYSVRHMSICTYYRCTSYDVFGYVISGFHLWPHHQASWNAAHFVGRLANRDPSRRSDVIRRLPNAKHRFWLRGHWNRRWWPAMWVSGVAAWRHECLSVLRETLETLFWMAFLRLDFSWTFGAIEWAGWNHKFLSFGSDFFFQLQLSSALPPP